MLFLAKYKLISNRYMSDKIDEESVTKIVEAPDEDAARRAINDLVDSMTSEYSIYYRADGIEIDEAIVVK